MTSPVKIASATLLTYSTPTESCPSLVPKKAASTLGLLDRNKYIVESIFAHTGTPSRLTSLKFLVHWAGYPTDEDTWEPWI